jgi:hypothetical protein
MTTVDLATVLPPNEPANVPENLRQLAKDRGYEIDWSRHRIFATRRMARNVAELLPAGPVTLDCSGVEAMTSPFIHELRSLHDVTAVAMNEDVQASWDLVEERLRDA